MNATPGSERERAARNHTQQYACCRLPYHGAADVPREIAGGRREDRERRPAGRERERETADCERGPNATLIVAKRANKNNNQQCASIAIAEGCKREREHDERVRVRETAEREHYTYRAEREKKHKQFSW